MMFKSLFLTVALLAGAVVWAETPLADFDFGAATAPFAVKGSGAFTGVLPAGWGQDFAGWTTSVATTAVETEGTRKFLRFSVSALGKAVQFNTGISHLIKTPGDYKLKVTYRLARSSAPFRLTLRLSQGPYATLWSSPPAWGTGAWREAVFPFALTQECKAPFGIFLYLPMGETDIQSIRLETATPAEIAAASPVIRPPRGEWNFFRNTRFPLGLQSGWNFAREDDGQDAAGAVCGPAADHPGPSGYPALKIQPAGPATVFSEPFQTSDPAAENHVSFACKGAGAWSVTVLGAGATQAFTLSGQWQTVTLDFKPNAGAKALGLRFSGQGALYLDSLQAWAGDRQHPYRSARQGEVALAPVASAIRETRIQFADEPARIAYCATGDLAGTVLKYKIVNHDGAAQTSPGIALAGPGKLAYGELAYNVFPGQDLGQFRIEAWLEKDGRRVSPYNELVMTRLHRPRYWGKDAPNSPFGDHFMSSAKTITTMKAAGVNWARLHDAATPLTCWYDLEPQKGNWVFNDQEVNRYRQGKIMLFGGLVGCADWAASETPRSTDDYWKRWRWPSHDAEFADYVKAVCRHYDGIISEYYVWNEPWGGWGGGKTAADYAALTKVAYQAAKSVNPALKISGFNSTASQMGGQWTKDVMAAGGLAFCDRLDYHTYTASDYGWPGDSAAAGVVEAAGPARAQKPVYMSEGSGLNTGDAIPLWDFTGMNLHALTWKSEENPVCLADLNSRFVLSLLANQVAKVFLYSDHCYTSMVQDPSFVTLLGRDGYPSPTLAAFSNLAWHLEDKKLVGVVPVGTGVWKYVFRGPGGTTEVISGLRNGRYAVPAAPSATVVDLFGNPVKAPSHYQGTLLYVDFPPGLQPVTH